MLSIEKFLQRVLKIFSRVTILVVRQLILDSLLMILVLFTLSRLLSIDLVGSMIWMTNLLADSFMHRFLGWSSVLEVRTTDHSNLIEP